MEYPEFFVALAVLAVAFSTSGKELDWTWPSWMTRPAKSSILMLPDRYVLWVQRSLVHAGWRSNLSFGKYACFKTYPPFLAVLSAPFLALPYVASIAVAIWLIPDAYLTLRVKKRQQEIHKSLPQALDLMVLCVDAGLGLDATLHRISTEESGISNALNDELNLLGREILLGIDRERAYQELYIRTGVDELKTIGAALGQANKLGLSIARILRAQSDFIRKRQSQRAEEKAMKMPIYMAFPLWFFIMPALMLLVLGPSLIRFYGSLAQSVHPF
jgi:tight adherence protein C